jgi:hypothetical protein
VLGKRALLLLQVGDMVQRNDELKSCSFNL